VFASVSLANLGFSLRLLLGGVYPAVTLPASLVTLALLILSTSSTAYVALPVLLTVVLITSALRAAKRRTNAGTVVFVFMLPLVVFFGVMIILISPDLYDTVYNFIDVSILSKAQSDSGIERTQWNMIALQNFIETYGFGVGIGGVRASSFVIAVLANMGVIGGLAYFVFIYQVLTNRVREPESFAGSVQAAAQMGCVGILGSALLSGTMVDLGLQFYILAGVAVAATKAASPRKTALRTAKTGAIEAPSPAGLQT
jgi:hypothetical protein